VGRELVLSHVHELRSSAGALGPPLVSNTHIEYNPTPSGVGGGSLVKRQRNVSVVKVLVCTSGIDLILHHQEPGGRFCIQTKTLLAGGGAGYLGTVTAIVSTMLEMLVPRTREREFIRQGILWR
jgi:hypothetical protein